MSFIKELPFIPDLDYSEEDIELFDEYKDDYLEFTEAIKSVYNGLNTSVDLDHKSPNEYSHDEYEDYIKSKEEWISANTENDTYNIRRLVPLRTERIMRTGDLISAFYIPEDLDWFEVEQATRVIEEGIDPFNLSIDPGNMIYNTLARYDSKNLGMKYYSTEEIMDQARELPDQLEEFSREETLDDILSKSKKMSIVPDGCGEEIIEINGIKYKRIILFYPVLPILRLIFTELRWKSSDHRPIYMEEITLTERGKTKLGPNKLHWVGMAKTGPVSKLITYSCGTCWFSYSQDPMASTIKGGKRNVFENFCDEMYDKACQV